MSKNINSTDWSSNYINLTKSHLTKFYRNFLIKKLKIFKIVNNKNASILDFGCGFGYFLNYFYSRGYRNLYGVDPDKELLKRVPKQIKTSVQFGEKISFEDNSFDVVWVYCVFHHLEKDTNYFEAVDEIMRVLKPNGYLFICEPGHYRSFVIMEYITKILSFFSKFFKSYKLILEEEKVIVRYFIKNHHKVIDRLREKKINEIENTYIYEKWLYVCQKLS